MTEKSSCSGNCESCGEKGSCSKSMLLDMPGVNHKIVVLSGKGGVGKSTVSTNLALALALAGKSVGLLDVDIHGPSIPKMLGIEGREIMTDKDGKILPIEIGSLNVMSIGLVMQDPDSAVIWRGPMKIGVIKQFLEDVNWGRLDYLVIDTPPGTGDEPLSVCQFIPEPDGAVIVTTPQAVSENDVSKSFDFCSQLSFPVIGVVENMSGFVCPKCGEITHIFSSGAGERLAEKFGVPMLARIPIDPSVCAGGDAGKPFVHSNPESPAAKAFAPVVARVLEN